jgi:pyruvate kinase
MLFSMMNSPRPTRAEASDVANAVFDHVDGIYLSDETASGKFPVEAVHAASEVIRDAEKSIYDNVTELNPVTLAKEDQSLASLARHAAAVAREIKARAIVVTTVTGKTAQAVASARVEVPILAVTAHKKVQRQLALVWGVDPIVAANIVSLNTVNDDIQEILQKKYRAKKGDSIVFVDGVRQDKTEGENLVHVRRIT